MGRPQFEQVVATAPREYMNAFTIQDDTTLFAGEGHNYYFYAPDNTVAQMITSKVEFPAISGASTGTHYVVYGYFDPLIDLLNATHDYNSNLTQKSNIFSGTVEQGGTEIQMKIMKSIEFDDKTPLKVYYKNASDGDATATRILTYWCKVRQVG